MLHGRSHYREIIRVPLLVRDPGWPRGRRIATPVSLVDVAPTLLRALGVALPVAPWLALPHALGVGPFLAPARLLVVATTVAGVGGHRVALLPGLSRVDREGK